jgi:hypothetical protein
MSMRVLAASCAECNRKYIGEEHGFFRVVSGTPRREPLNTMLFRPGLIGLQRAGEL